METKKHYAIYFLLGVFVVLGFFNFRQERYALGSNGTATAHVLNTKTGQLWLRFPNGKTYNLGTNQVPKFDIIEKIQKIESFEEMIR